MDDIEKAQNVASIIVGIICASLVFWYIVSNFNVISIIAALGLGVCLYSWSRSVVISILSDILIRKHYGADNEAFLKDTEMAARNYGLADADTKVAIELIVKDCPEKHIGMFKDAKIYEWLDLSEKDSDIVNRFYFDRTVDNVDTYQIAPDSILLFPGVVYKRESQQG